MNKLNLPRLKAIVAQCVQVGPDLLAPQILVISLRMVLEEVVNSFVECFGHAYLREDLSAKIMFLRVEGYFTDDLARKANRVRKVGNIGAHGGRETITADEAREAIANIQEIVEYYEQY